MKTLNEIVILLLGSQNGREGLLLGYPLSLSSTSGYGYFRWDQDTKRLYTKSKEHSGYISFGPIVSLSKAEHAAKNIRHLHNNLAQMNMSQDTLSRINAEADILWTKDQSKMLDQLIAEWTEANPDCAVESKLV